MKPIIASQNNQDSHSYPSRVLSKTLKASNIATQAIRHSRNNPQINSMHAQLRQHGNHLAINDIQFLALTIVVILWLIIFRWSHSSHIPFPPLNITLEIWSHHFTVFRELSIVDQVMRNLRNETVNCSDQLTFITFEVLLTTLVWLQLRFFSFIKTGILYNLGSGYQSVTPRQGGNTGCDDTNHRTRYRSYTLQKFPIYIYTNDSS